MPIASKEDMLKMQLEKLAKKAVEHQANRPQVKNKTSSEKSESLKIQGETSDKKEHDKST